MRKGYGEGEREEEIRMTGMMGMYLQALVLIKLHLTRISQI